jgi:hypothetical protein
MVLVHRSSAAAVAVLLAAPAGAGDWTASTMGVVRGVYNRQGGPSGQEAFESSNWLMVTAERGLGPGNLMLMSMTSLEPATIHHGGSPQIFQAGETFEGRPLVDRQHPHDFFMNLSATYRQPLRGTAAAWLQLAPRGEPALGPTAFMHRASAGDNPTAVLGHHQQDSTHIADSVITAGGRWRRLTLEASAFHGREPDEGRWDLDPGALDSASVRLKADLGRGWSGQVSHGFLNEPEALEPGDTRRTTASLHYGAGGDRRLAASVIWGRNREEHGRFDAWLAEGAFRVTPADQVYARAERVQRDAHLLREKAPDHEHDEPDIVGVRALTAGYLRELKKWPQVRWLGDLDAGVGVDLTVYGFPQRLEGAYGESPGSVHAFLRLRWGPPQHAGHAMSH